MYLCAFFVQNNILTITMYICMQYLYNDKRMHKLILKELFLIIKMQYCVGYYY